MSHIINQQVKEGEEVIRATDTESREATSGTLGMGVTPSNKAEPLSLSRLDGMLVNDAEGADLLKSILTELQIINKYNALIHDVVISDKDLSNE